MSSVSEGMNASISIGGTVVGWLEGITFGANRTVTPYTSMGSVEPNDALLGPNRYTGGFQKAYIDNTFFAIFKAGTGLVGTIFPRGGTTPYIAGTIVLSNWTLSNMKKDTETNVVDGGDFVMYSVTPS